MAVRERSAEAATWSDRLLASALLLLAVLGWWWSVVSSRDMGAGMAAEMDMAGAAAMSLGAFLVAWVAMMAAMMLPAVLPVVRLYARASAKGTVAPVPVFLAGYAVVWSALGAPVFLVWRWLDEPLANGSVTAGRVAGAVLVTAGAYQFSPLKSVCLRHCRSPLSFFMEHGTNLHRPVGALSVGARHGLYCLGCCWMLMAVLVAFGTMDLRWMALVAAVILVEKATPIGDRVAPLVGAVFLIGGALVLLNPHMITNLT